MAVKYSWLTIVAVLVVSAATFAQGRKIDTTMKYTSAGYRVYCNNKSAEKNGLTISLIGFSNKSQRDANFEVKGRLKSAIVDDFNNDGFPDLLLCVYNGKDGNFGTVIGIASENNESIKPVYFPDILDDTKLRVGYKGSDEFTMIEGTVMRTFPVYNVADTANIKPTGMLRHIQYKMATTEGGVYKFKVLRTYETKL